MPSRSSRSIGKPRRPPARPPGVDVYLLPAVVGGGLGDIEEVLAAGRRLARAGFPILLYRRPGSPLPRSVEGPWDWPPVRRVRRLRPRGRAALTVAPAWGVSAAPRRPGPFGRPGPWTDEVADIEEAYGPDRVLHVSLEEFARTLTARAETRERFREGGVRARAVPDRLRRAEEAGEVTEFRKAYVRFRAFDRPNVLAVFATFAPSRAFAREYPRAVQTGPLWPERFHGSRPRRRADRRGEWVWYASPASAERIAPEVVAGLAASTPPVRLFVRSPRAWSRVPAAPNVVVTAASLPPEAWRRRFAAADLRIVTGSRTLLEALELGGPFLYFNGVLGAARRRRHRPEKFDALRAVARSRGVPRSLLRDLGRFAQGQDVRGVVARAAGRTAGWESLRRAARRPAFPSPRGDAGGLLVTLARALAKPAADAPSLAERIRRSAKA